MKKFALVLTLTVAGTSALADEMIVFIRHGEKPEKGLGQLSCHGLNRSLALPDVLIKKFGKPDAIFAPNPAKFKDDLGTQYAYVRPLATIEPTAIRLGLPVNVQFGFANSAKLQSTLLSQPYKNAVVLVSWEHHWAQKIAKELVASIDKNEAAKIPVWQDDDFDSIYVVRIGNGSGKKNVSFSLDKQGLASLSDNCPTH
ncbi:hypothetical protein [Glaciimonas soli]|uniref:Histidine phosphatase family protein n=1 Tax=Glaciimonas soli TaxID=2590999 RepID=A0A843YUT0_9BURK|nr:hypothetical protein [Glaciimonas soli]MQR01258.1 hypothetical protein [Glaciimonas soli]